MAAHTEQFKRRLGRVRRRYRLTVAFQGLLLVVTEALGMFLLFLLADWIYKFGGHTRLYLLCVGGAVLAVLCLRHLVYPFLRRVPDEQVALLIEERVPESAQGSVISALEFGRVKPKGLSGYITSFLVDDAVARIDRSNLQVVANLRRLRKHAVAAAVLLVFFAAPWLMAPGFMDERVERIIFPGRSIAEERARDVAERERQSLERHLRYGPISFEVYPGNTRVLRGSAVDIVARLSREPADVPVLKFRTPGGEEQTLSMRPIEALHGFARPLPYVSEQISYHIASSRHKSDTYTIDVYDPLSIRGIELTYHYPEYLERKPLTTFGESGDISVVAGTKVDVGIVGNNRLEWGELRFDDGRKLPLAADPKDKNTRRASFVVEKDTNYTVAVRDVDKQDLAPDDFYYVKAVPDNPPTVEMVSPRVDMSVHPLCEVTFRGKVTDDYGVKAAEVKADLFRGAERTPLKWEMKVTDSAGSDKNVQEGKAEYVLELESAKPQMKIGDMIFYHLEVVDRKGQSARTDLFFIKMMPLEVAANWPAGVAPPDLPHEVFNDPMDLMLFMAAAWHVEQQRGKIPEGEFKAKSEGVGDRMAGGLGDPPNFGLFWGYGGDHGIGVAAANREEVLAQATRHIEVAYDLLKHKHEPGQAANQLCVALAMAESVFTDKRHVPLELNPEPIHTGQPSSGYSNDPISEQIEFRGPSTMSDALTAFQQPDNPPRLLPPDYRRSLRIKQRQGALTKQLKIAGEIYATEEQLIEMAREQLGHIRLREAIDPNSPNDPSVMAGLGGQMIRVDKRAIPYKDLEKSGATPEDRLQLPTPQVERIKGLPSDRIPDNRRRGGPNPFTTQAQSSSPGGGEDEEPEPWDQTDTERQRQRREPSGGSGGGSGMPPMGEQSPQDQQPQGAGGQAGMQGLAGQQAQQADRARDLARDIARTMQPGDALAAGTIRSLRDAATAMDQASRHFNQGQVRQGLAEAMAAQRFLRTAMSRMQVGQHESLQAAMDAAQSGAMALAGRAAELSGKGGSGQPAEPSRSDVQAAMKSDPRLGGQLKGLAGQQAGLARDLKDFQQYVKDLREWADETKKERVAGALGDVGTALRRDDTTQKMVNAAVNLAGQDVKAAWPAHPRAFCAGWPWTPSPSTGECGRSPPPPATPGAARASPARPDREKAGPVKARPVRASPAKPSPAKASLAKASPVKVSPVKASPEKVSLAKVSPVKASPANASLASLPARD